MNIKELKEKLSLLDENLTVVREGFDGGYENIYDVTETVIVDRFADEKKEEKAVVLS